jgi:hypothetical protein
LRATSFPRDWKGFFRRSYGCSVRPEVGGACGFETASGGAAISLAGGFAIGDVAALLEAFSLLGDAATTTIEMITSTAAANKKSPAIIFLAALQVEVQHFAEKMLHGKNVSAVEFGGAYRAPGA